MNADQILFSVSPQSMQIVWYLLNPNGFQHSSLPVANVAQTQLLQQLPNPVGGPCPMHVQQSHSSCHWSSQHICVQSVSSAMTFQSPLCMLHHNPDMEPCRQPLTASVQMFLFSLSSVTVEGLCDQNIQSNKVLMLCQTK